MSTKPADRVHRTKRAQSNTDTTSFDQLHGSPQRSAPKTPNPKMPHERDESARASEEGIDDKQPASQRQILQAHEDVEQGLVDTDRRGTPSDIPSEGKK